MKESLVRIERGIYMRLSNKSYWIQYRKPLVPGGKKTRVVQERLLFCTNINEARKALSAKVRDLFVGEHRVVDADLTLGEFLEEFLKTKAHRKVAKKYKQQITQRFASWLKRPLAAIKRVEVFDWYARRRERVAISTANNEVAALRALFNEAVNQELVLRNPCARLGLAEPNNERDRILSDDEAFRLSAAAAKRDDFMRPLWFLLYATGARLYELLSLRWEQIDLKARWVRIYDAKSGKLRIVPLAKQVLAHLRWWAKRSAGNFVFPSGSKLGHLIQVGKSWRTLLRDAKVQNLIRHDMRHNFVSQLQDAGVPDKITMAITGHKTVVSLHRYSHSKDRAKQRAIQAIPWRSHPAVTFALAEFEVGRVAVGE